MSGNHIQNATQKMCYAENMIITRVMTNVDGSSETGARVLCFIFRIQIFIVKIHTESTLLKVGDYLSGSKETLKS